MVVGESTGGHGFSRRAHADTSKDEATWCGALWHYKCRIRFNPEIAKASKSCGMYVYTFESIRNPRIFENLIKMLALQIGQLVSINELALALGVSRATVEKYIKLLEQSYVIKTIKPFSRNTRNEIKKAFKIYFIDTGVRNAVVDNVSKLTERQDKGALFENFFIMERFKNSSSEAFPPQIMFWCT